MAKATSTEEKNKGKAGVKSAKPVRKGEGGTSTDGLHRALKVSPELEAVIGVKEVARADAVSKIWAYIRENNLQNPEDKREILPPMRFLRGRVSECVTRAEARGETSGIRPGKRKRCDA